VFVVWLSKKFIVMIRNYLIVAIRNIWKNKTLSFIKIFGLSVGLAVCILMFLYSKDELSFDRFHAKKENIYRIVQDMEMTGQPRNKLSITQPPMAEAFAREIPEVKARVRLADMMVTIKKDNDVLPENALCVDDNFFSVFDFDQIGGKLQSALTDKYSVVLSQSAATKYFGSANPIGKIMQVKKRDEFQNFTVTAVVADPPKNSTIIFSMLMPFAYFNEGGTHDGWIGGSINSFLLLGTNADPAKVTAKMQQVYDKNTHAQILQAEQEQKMKIKLTMGLQPLLDIHMNKELGAFNGLAEASTSAYSYILSGIAIFILLIACINFINLSIGQSLKRSREIGIRKVVGGNRSQLIVQFLTESFVVSLLAFVFATVIAFSILPFFNELSGKKLALSYLADGWLYAGWFLLLLITAFLAGIYPALVLSGLKTLNVLWGRKKLMGKNYFARGLIVFQFTLAIFLIMAAFAIYAQLDFLLKRDLGYDARDLVKIDLPFSDKNSQIIDGFKRELGNNPGVLQIAARNGGRWGTGVWADGKQITIDKNAVDFSFFNAMKIPFSEGRNFSPDFPSDSAHSVIVNETFVREAGWKGSAVGKVIEDMDSKKKTTVIGVIRDYHYGSLKEKIGPQVFWLGPSSDFGAIWIKLDHAQTPATLAVMAETYHQLSPFNPYKYDFIELTNARSYDDEARWKKIASISAIIFIFISCIGLLGLVMLSVEQRTKEIGIRKVLGAAAMRIIFLISAEFTWLVLIAFLIAMPLAYYGIHRWLEDFPYRTTIQWWLFGVAGLLIIALAWATIGFQAVKAALANPVKALRTE